MANQKHLTILKQGVACWNQWRKENRKVIPDLTEVTLSDTNFKTLLLIQQADFEGIDFSQTLLHHSVLRGANLRNSLLCGANLRTADLRRADLKGADLSRASLHQANLTLANLYEANLKEALFWETVLARVNLNNALGLESCRHGGPSIIDHRTLRRSGDLPLTFLRGCGLPDELIKYLTSATAQSDMFYSCFISYSSIDDEFARKLYSGLQNSGVRCWFAPEDLKIGERIRIGIDESIPLHDKLLLVLSENSVASDWVEKEVETAMEQERNHKRTVLFPIRLDDTIMNIERGWPADIRRTRNIGDFREWKDVNLFKQAFNRLLRDLKSEDSQ